MEQYETEPKKLVNRAGFSLFFMAAAIFAAQNLVYVLIYRFNPKMTEMSGFSILLTAISVICFGLPVIYAVLRKLPEADHKEAGKLKLSEFIGAFFICAAFMYIGNIIGAAVNYVISLIKGSSIVNPIEDVLTQSNMIANILYVSIVGPIVEELIFRKLLLNRLRSLGDAPAIILSGLAFGFFHMNLSQFFYASLLGFIFAYIAVRTNSIRYTVILHIMINLLGSVIAPLSLTGNLMVQLLLSLWMYVSTIIGLGLFFIKRKEITLLKGELTIQKKSDYILNPGTILFLLFCIAAMIYVILE